MRNLLLLLVLIFPIASCKKNGFAYIEGTVYECGTSNPVEGAKVQITKSFHHNQEENYEDALTDSKGHFKIRYTKGPSSVYDVRIKSSDYEYTGYKKLDLRKEKAVFYLGNKTKVRLTIKNSRSEQVNVFFTDPSGQVSLFRIQPNRDSICPVSSFSGCGENSYSWQYISSSYTSGIVTEAIYLAGTADTLLRSIDIK